MVITPRRHNMKYLLVLLLSLSPLALGQVPDTIWDSQLGASYVVYNDGLVRYVPDTHEVVIQPKGGWNTAPFTWTENPLGVYGNTWPFFDALCVHLGDRVGAGETVPYPPKACNEPRYVVRK